MATASAKNTLGNIFGMVGIAAGAVASTIETGVEGIDMLDRFVKKQAAKQIVHNTLEMAAFELDLLDEMSLDRSVRQNEVLKFCNESTINADLYKTNIGFFTKVLADSKNA